MGKDNVFMINYKDIFLRDPVEEDVKSYIRWNIYEDEWKQWDAPWEELEKDEAVIREKILHIIHREKPRERTRLQLCFIDGTHIGSVSCYKIDGQEDKPAIGIDIPEKCFWGKGIGKQALELWIAYLFSVNSYSNIYTQTWSGNIRMINLAKRLGFEEAVREVGKREVRGEMYDGLTFILTRERFMKDYNMLIEQVVLGLEKNEIDK